MVIGQAIFLGMSGAALSSPDSGARGRGEPGLATSQSNLDLSGGAAKMVGS
jgi:hypothetical protein